MGHVIGAELELRRGGGRRSGGGFVARQCFHYSAAYFTLYSLSYSSNLAILHSTTGTGFALLRLLLLVLRGRVDLYRRGARELLLFTAQQ